ncbi:MAPEG family protein [Litorimonas sp. RW-G-Af-16]|uniref:MAPEG family protein n=1 Tax=Litorimonas sp. RW-G-Af-16 TaxID=3241168 RepID=UPI00390C4D9D
MPIELVYLASTAFLLFGQILVQALASIRSHSLKFLVGPRDGIEDNNVLSERCRRTNANLIEGMIMFTPLVLICAHLNVFSPLTALAAALFFWSRVVFAITYWLGVPWVRTLAWFASIIAIFMFAWELFV